MSYNETYNTNLEVITLKDNLSHKYFSSISWSKDNYLPLGVATLIMPYMEESLQYWRSYFDVVVISANMVNSNGKIFVDITNPATLPQSNDMKNNTLSNIGNNTKVGNQINNQTINTLTDLSQLSKNISDLNSNTKEAPQIFTDDATINSNAPYNYSFIGRVSQVKQRGKIIIITLQDLGWKFLQKVPKDFRDNYIANATLDDAFQAICEFLNVDFAYSIEDLHELNFYGDGYSVQKNNEIIEDVPSILKEWTDTSEEEDSSLLDDETNENEGLIEYNNEHKKKNKTQKTSTDDNKNDKTLANATSDNTNNNKEEDNEEEEDSDTLQTKIDQFQAEFDEKVKKLFIGNMMYNSNLTSNVMDYGSITVQPSGGAGNGNMTGVSGSGDGSDSSSTSSTKYLDRALKRCFGSKLTKAVAKPFRSCKTKACVSKWVNSKSWASKLKVSKSSAITMITDALIADGKASKGGKSSKKSHSKKTNSKSHLAKAMSVCFKSHTSAMTYAFYKCHNIKCIAGLVQKHSRKLKVSPTVAVTMIFAARNKDKK